MIHKGQIVEIPITSPIYNREMPFFSSKKEELLWKSSKRDYSLFDGFIVGGHLGIEHFRIGQRKGINVGGKKEPLYVIAIDNNDNRVFVGAGEAHPALWTEVLLLPKNRMDWSTDFNEDDSILKDGISVKIQSQILDQATSAKLYLIDGETYLEFEKPISVTIDNYPMDIILKDNIIANIKTI